MAHITLQIPLSEIKAENDLFMTYASVLQDFSQRAAHLIGNKWLPAVLMSALFRTTVVANSTLPLQGSIISNPPCEPEIIQQYSGYGDNDFHDSNKKPPRSRDYFSVQPASLWLVPVLRYLVTVNGNSIQMETTPVTSLLPVILQTTASWWFHEQEVIELLRGKNETVVGDPVLYTPEPVDGGGGKTTRTTADSSASIPHEKRKCLSHEVSEQPSGSYQGDERKREDQRVHHCTAKTCPACNHCRCHCLRCSATQAMPASIVTLLEHRRHTGTLPIRHPKLAQLLLEKGSNLQPETVLAGHVYNLHAQYVVQEHWALTHPPLRMNEFFVVLRNSIQIEDVVIYGETELLSWANDGIKIWSAHNGSWSAEQVPVAVHKIYKVFAIHKNRMVVWFSNGALQEWTKRNNIWVGKGLSSGITHAVQLSGGSIITFTQQTGSLREWKYTDNEWVLTDLIKPEESVDGIAILPASRFLTMTRKQTEGGTEILFHAWREEDGIWNSSIFCRFDYDAFIDLAVLYNGKAMMVVERKGGNHDFIAWYEQTQVASEISGLDSRHWQRHTGGILPDGRLYTTRSKSGSREGGYRVYRTDDSLVLLAEVNGDWETTLLIQCPEDKLCRYKLLSLSGGRLAVGCSYSELDIAPASGDEYYGESTMQILVENRGIWQSVTLGHFHSEVLGMKEWHKNYLITWHLNGKICIWNLFPGMSDHGSNL